MNLLRLALLAFFISASISPGQADDETAQYPGVKGTDKQIAQRLIGVWTGKEKGFLGTLEYHADGSTISKLVPVDFPMTVFASAYSFNGTWRVEHGVLYSTVVTATTPKIPPGKVYQNLLLDLTPTLFVTKNELGWITRFQRQP